jgi:hypothetical protein
MQVMGKMLILCGVVIMVMGLVLAFSDKLPLLGKLPGDITIKKENVRIFLPITTSIVLSVLISVVLWVLSHIRGK